MGETTDAIQQLSQRDPAVAEFVQNKLPVLRREWEPVHVILFGSRSRGTATGASDIDLIVVSPRFDGIPWPNRPALVLQLIYPRQSADILCYTPEEFEQKRREAGIVATACEEGIWL